MEQIRLKNFRCYTDQTIVFRPGINLLIGDNASGKTSVLKACKYVLSAFFSGFSDENTKWISPEIGDFTQSVDNGIIRPELPIEICFQTKNIFEHNALKSLEGDTISGFTEVDDVFILQKRSKKNSRPLTGGLGWYRMYAKLLSHNYFSSEESVQCKALPLFACFSTEDIHATRKINAKNFLKYAQKSSFGYYECLDGNGFLQYWLKRLLVLKEGKKNLEEIEIVRRAIVKALAEGCSIIRDMEIRPNQKKVYYILADNREVEAELLSDGYRRLVNIVTDLAFRCALLNRGIYGLDACSQTQGTVLIDEIDLHLHPSLQARVLKALRLAFPKLQFIVTTHAPLVMSGVKSNEENIVYKLRYSPLVGYKVDEIQTYGMDVSTITDVVLEQTPRDKEVNEELNQLFAWIDEEKRDEAWSLLKSLQKRFGNLLPELAEAEAMLNFTIEDDAADSEE